MNKPIILYATTVSLVSGLIGVCLLINGYDRMCLAIDEAFS